MTRTSSSSRLVRLSDGWMRAVEVTASDPESLARALTAAYEEYCHQERAMWELTDRVVRRIRVEDAGRLRLQLHVWVGGRAWSHPCGHGWCEVMIGRSELDGWSPADWLTAWNRVSKGYERARALGGFVSRVVSAACPPAELRDPDRAGA